MNQTLPTCTGPCEQGRKACPTPDACERASDYDGIGAIRGIVFAVPLGLLLWALIALVAMVPWGEAQSFLLALLDFGSQL